MAVKKGDKITVEYEGRLENGEIFDSSAHGDHSHPLEFEVGSGELIKGFDDGVIGMKKDEEKEIVITPDNAYGQRNPKLVKTIPRQNIPNDQEPKPGMMLQVGLPDGKRIPAFIAEVNDKEVTIDLNHPLAGKTLIFKIKVVKID